MTDFADMDRLDFENQWRNMPTQRLKDIYRRAWNTHVMSLYTHYGDPVDEDSIPREAPQFYESVAGQATKSIEIPWE